ncbi:MAG: ATP-binding protein [Deltaproteobacteria bacterium]|nr:ATP-binding protein [Deltaproteobacteria bacterium]
MYARSLTLPNHSFFLFGPRGTGKTTWLRKVLPHALWRNLLLDEDYLPLLGDSSLLRRAVDALPAGSWVVIDEVQRLPGLLNEVHDLISRRGDAIKFAMSGSSARKLRRAEVNLLAGRAIDRRLFPFTSQELGDDFDLDAALTYGTLPAVVQDPSYAADILEAYIGTYLTQEIQQEALVKDLGSFHRFLQIIGLLNGEQINTSAIARDAAVARTTVERYLSVFVDTLLGYRLPAWRPRIKVRERARPKFYLFDPGIVRTLLGRTREGLAPTEAGKLLETFVLHELRSAVSYKGCGGTLSFWRSSGGAEIDFVWSRADRHVGIEVKASHSWRRSSSRALKDLHASGILSECFAIYRGKDILRDGPVLVLPYEEFSRRLHRGEILA